MAYMGQLDKDLRDKAHINKTHAKTPLESVQAQFLSRGAKGIKGAQRRFRIMDDDGSKTLSFSEFSKGIKDVGIVFKNEEQYLELFKQFDRDGQGTIDFEEFLRVIQPKMNARRIALVEAAFAKMDKTGDGVITVHDLAKNYNVEKHPKYMSGEWTQAQVYKDYLSTFEAEGHVDGNVTIEEFTSYYACISCSIDNDAYFDLMMRNSWGADL